MAQPTGQRLVDSGHALAGFFAYANGTGLWDAQNGAMLTKVGSGAVTSEGGANVVNSASNTYYTLASSIVLSGAFSIGFRVRTTGTTNAAMVLGQHTTTTSYIWLNDGSGNTRFTGSTIGANGGTTTMTTWHIVRDGPSQPIRLYKNGTLQATLANSGTGALTISSILKGYSSSTTFDFNGTLEWVHVLPAGTALTQEQITSLVADPYQMLQADTSVSVDAAGTGAMAWVGSGSVNASIGEAPLSVTASGSAAMTWAGSGSADVTVLALPAGTIALTSPTARTMRQRSIPANTASFTVAGTYTGAPGSIQYRFAGGAWQTLVASPAGGTFSASVALPTGQGALEVRHASDTSVTASVALITVGDIFATAGQSNNVGAATSVVAPVATNFQPLEYLGGAWVDLREGTTTGTSYSGLSGYGGSYVGALCNRLQAAGIPVGFIPCAQGSTMIASWQKGGGLYTTMMSRIAAVGGVRAVMFWLGESDANNGTTQTAFETGVNQMINDIWTDISTPVFMHKIVAWIAAATTLRGWQDNIIASNPHVIGSADCDVYAPSGVHYLTTTDINNVADRVFAGMVTAFYSGPVEVGAAGIGAITWAGEGSASLTLTATTVSAAVAAAGAMAWAGLAAVGADLLPMAPAIAATVAGAAAMLWRGIGSANVNSSGVVLPDYVPTSSRVARVTSKPSYPPPSAIAVRVDARGRFYTTHAPGAGLDYGIDWTEALAADETIIESEWSASPGVVVSRPQLSGGAVTSAFVTGGRARRVYVLKNRITTSAGRTDIRTITLSCRTL